MGWNRPRTWIIASVILAIIVVTLILFLKPSSNALSGAHVIKSKDFSIKTADITNIADDIPFVPQKIGSVIITSGSTNQIEIIG